MFVRAVTLAPYHQIINALIPLMFWGIMFKAMLVLELSGDLCVDRYGDVSGRMLATASFRIRIYSRQPNYFAEVCMLVLVGNLLDGHSKKVLLWKWIKCKVKMVSILIRVPKDPNESIETFCRRRNKCASQMCDKIGLWSLCWASRVQQWHEHVLRSACRNSINARLIRNHRSDKTGLDFATVLMTG